jgi:hypothetical protein
MTEQINDKQSAAAADHDGEQASGPISDEIELASFEANILQVELWLVAADRLLSDSVPSVKKLRIHSNDIPTVLEEATKQAKATPRKDLAERYFDTIPRLTDYLRRSDEIFKRDAQNEGSGSNGPPPSPPVDSGSGAGDDGRMEKRVEKLESTVEKFTAQIASVQENVAVIKSNYATKDDVTGVKGDVGVIKSNYSTKEDLAKMESTILKVFITTAIALTGLVFAVSKYIH